MAGMLDPNVLSANLGPRPAAPSVPAPAAQADAVALPPVGTPAPDPTAGTSSIDVPGAAPGGPSLLSSIGQAIAGAVKGAGQNYMSMLNPPGASTNATPTDAAAAPIEPHKVHAQPFTVAEHMTRNLGTPMTTFQTKEHDPKHMTLEEAVAANSHLTPTDIQMMMPLFQAKMNPHNAMFGTLQEIAEGERQAALAHATTASQITAANDKYWNRAKPLVAPQLNPSAVGNVTGDMLRKQLGMQE